MSSIHSVLYQRFHCTFYVPLSLHLLPSFHVGSNCKDPHFFNTALEMVQQLFVFGESLGYQFTLLDIGGGFPGLSHSHSDRWSPFQVSVPIPNLSIAVYPIPNYDCSFLCLSHRNCAHPISELLGPHCLAHIPLLNVFFQEPGIPVAFSPI